MADPTYVKLPERAWSGMMADLETGWSISGLDVKEFPDSEEEGDEAAFVRSALRYGNLEAATAAEYEAVQSAHEAVAKVAPDPKAEIGQQSPWNEAAIQKASRRERSKLLRKRFGADTEEGAREAARREAAQAEAGQYGEMSKDELQALAANRGLDTSGTKKDLTERLQEDDAKAGA